MYKLSRIIKGGTQTILRTVSVNASTKVVNKVNEQVKPWREIPGPLSLPIIGQFLHFLPGGWLYKRTIELQGLLYKQYGPIVRIDGAMGFPPITFIFDPAAVLNLFRKEDTNPFRPGLDSITYYRKHYYNKNDDDPLGLILGNNENWKKFRSTVNPVMLHTKTIKQYANVMEEVAEDMVKRMKLLRNKNNMLEGNFFLDLNLWALESIAVVALGSRLNCFDPNLSEDSPVKKLIDNVHGVFNTLEKLDFQPNIWKYIATPEFKKGMQVYENNAKINEFFIDKAVSELSKRKTNDTEKSVLEKLLDIDRDVAVLMAHDMLLAGVDTSASTVLGALYLLATSPEKQNKLREEVMLKEDKRTYLKACIKESLRIFPILSGNFRKTMKEHEVLGYRIPKDMTVIAGNQQLCMMEEQFPRPTEFIPERWIVDKNDPLYYGNAHPFAFSPFGFGVRSCIGRRIAELEIETFLTKVIENFKIDWFGPMPKRVRKSTINYIEGPYNFIFKDL